MKLSALYGMEIVSENKKKRGFILGISCDKNVIDGVICCDERENRFFVKGEELAINGDKITFKSAAKKLNPTHLLRLGRAVYSPCGKFLGHLDDCTVKNFEITEARVGKRKFAFSALALGDVIILKEAPAKDMFIDAILS